jgi:predicted Holliday junction resolvase-like endonuclease
VSGTAALPWQTIAEVCGGLALLLLFLLFLVVGRLRVLTARLDDETYRRQSLSTTYGRITEQWFPLMPDYPYDPQNFRFLGSPVDGVQFEEDRIVFVEFKANRSRLSRSQEHYKRLIEEGYVYWEEFRFAYEDADPGR